MSAEYLAPRGSRDPGRAADSHVALGMAERIGLFRGLVKRRRSCGDQLVKVDWLCQEAGAARGSANLLLPRDGESHRSFSLAHRHFLPSM